MGDDSDYREYLEQPQKPPLPKSHDEQSLVVFLNWLLQPPKYRNFAYISSLQPLPEDMKQFIKSLLRPLPNQIFCDKLLGKSPKYFEELIADLLRRLGGQVIPGIRGADGGIDLFVKTPQGDYIVQCKRWKRKVGVAVVREVYGIASKSEAKGAFVISVSEFTDAAVYFSENLDPQVGLIDGRELFYLMTQIMPTVVEDIQKSYS